VPVPRAAALFGAPLPAFAAALGVGTNDYINLDHLPTAAAILQGAVPGPLMDNEILDVDEIRQIRDATRQFNHIISTQAEANGAVLVDVNAFLSQLARHGLVVGGRRLTTQFLGGIFSLDGIHPSNTGAAATADFFIKVMDHHAAAHIPPVSIRRIERNDPLASRGK